MRRVWTLVLVGLTVGACRDNDPEDFPVTDAREPYGELATAADTAEEAFATDEAVGVVAVQGGALVEGPLTATGNFGGDTAGRPPGAVTVTEVDGGTRLLISLDRYEADARLQATVVRGLCGEDGVVVAVVEPVITVPSTGLVTYEATVPLPTRPLFDGAHSLKLVPAPAAEGPQDAGAVLACSNLMEVATD